MTRVGPHKLKIGIRLRLIDTFQVAKKGNFMGDELVGRTWAKYLERREDVERADVYPAEGPVADDLDVLIHFSPFLEKPDGVPHFWYMQNAYRWQDHPEGTEAVFEGAKGDFMGFAFTSERLRDACAPGVVIPFATDPEFFYPQVKPEFEFPVSFVGNDIRTKTDNRRFVRPAIRRGLVIYGNGWKKRPYRGVHRGKLPMPDLPAVYSSTQVNLNFTLEEHVTYDTINLRIFDSLACMGFMLSDPVDSIEPTFGDAVAITTGGWDMRRQLKRFLADPAECQRRAKIGYELVLAKHTYAHRMDTLVDYLHQLL